MPVVRLLQASRATHVLTIVPVPLQPLRPNTLSENVIRIVEGAVQLSVAVAVPVSCVVGFCSHESVRDGGTVKVGAVLSMITIVWMQEAMLPHLSLACQWRVKVPVPLH